MNKKEKKVLVSTENLDKALDNLKWAASEIESLQNRVKILEAELEDYQNS